MFLDYAGSPSLRQADVQVFASGANREAEIRGFSRLGILVGVSVEHLNQAAIDALIELRQPVMVDTGAFSEMAFSSSCSRTGREISSEEWRRRLAICLRLAAGLSHRAMLVVPDKVGDQRETLLRLARFRREIGDLSKTGATLLLPLQVGEMTHLEFFETAQKLVGIPLTPAMPMRKATTSNGALTEFLALARPDHVHLLGIGMGNRRTEGLIRAIRDVSPMTSISMDSNILRATVGRNRPLSLLEAELRQAPIDRLWGEVDSPVLALNGQALDYTDLIAWPSCWIGSAQLEVIASEMRLSAELREIFLKSPDDFLQSRCLGFDGLTWIEHPVMVLLLDGTWRQFVERQARSGIRTAAITCVFSDSPARGKRAAKASGNRSEYEVCLQRRRSRRIGVPRPDGRLCNSRHSYSDEQVLSRGVRRPECSRAVGAPSQAK